MTQLCAASFVDDIAQAKRDIARAAEAGADMVELRIDRFTEPHLVRQLAEECILPAIFTCRPRWEGGECDLRINGTILLDTTTNTFTSASLRLKSLCSNERMGAGVFGTKGSCPAQ